MSEFQPDIDAEEPGLDLHEWQARYEQLAADLQDDPAAGLPLLADLVEELLGARGFALGDEVVRDGQSGEIVAEYRAAREVADRVERGEDVDPGDVGQAIEGLRALFDHVTANHPA